MRDCVTHCLRAYRPRPPLHKLRPMTPKGRTRRRTRKRRERNGDTEEIARVCALVDRVAIRVRYFIGMSGEHAPEAAAATDSGSYGLGSFGKYEPFARLGS